MWKVFLAVLFTVTIVTAFPKIQSSDGNAYADYEQLSILAKSIQQIINNNLAEIGNVEISENEAKSRFISSIIVLANDLRNGVRVIRHIISDNQDITEGHHETLKKTVENLITVAEALEQTPYIQDNLLKSYIKEKLLVIAEEARNLAFVGQNSIDLYIGTDLQDVLLVLQDSLQRLREELLSQSNTEDSTTMEIPRNTGRINEQESDKQRQPQAVIIIST